YPASYALDNVVAVAASTINEALASYSNYGQTTVDIVAPGSNILSTLPGSSYGAYSGTSMATPHVTGTLVLERDLHPGWTYTQLLSQLMNSADRLSQYQTRAISGGRLNAARAVGPVVGDIFGAHVISVVPNATGAGAVNSIRITFSKAIDPNSYQPGDMLFTGPTGATIPISSVQPVAGSGNKQYDVFFATQSVPGNYRLVVGWAVRGRSGNLMDFNGNGKNGEATDTYTFNFTIQPRFTYSSGSVVLPIRDFQTTTSSITVNQDFKIGAVRVTVNIRHTW